VEGKEGKGRGKGCLVFSENNVGNANSRLGWVVQRWSFWSCWIRTL